MSAQTKVASNLFKSLKNFETFKTSRSFFTKCYGVLYFLLYFVSCLATPSISPLLHVDYKLTEQCPKLCTFLVSVACLLDGMFCCSTKEYYKKLFHYFRLSVGLVLCSSLRFITFSHFKYIATSPAFNLCAF